jgi:predicted aspartyl protease
MITGIVNRDFEAIIPLSVYDSDGKIYRQDAIVDTGFNGWLSLFNRSVESEMEKERKRHSGGWE